jgi:hypothetical protein
LAVAEAGYELVVSADGCGSFRVGPNREERHLCRTEAMYALRLFHGGQTEGLSSSTLFELLYETLRTDQRCRRPDCERIIPEHRRLTALQNRVEAKWCSITCYKTEVARRFREKHRVDYVADPKKICELTGCNNVIPAARQIAGLVRKSHARWCSRTCGNRNHQQSRKAQP